MTKKLDTAYMERTLEDIAAVAPYTPYIEVQRWLQIIVDQRTDVTLAELNSKLVYLCGKSNDM